MGDLLTSRGLLVALIAGRFAGGLEESNPILTAIITPWPGDQLSVFETVYGSFNFHQTFLRSLFLP